jgi:hypothetical protein
MPGREVMSVRVADRGNSGIPPHATASRGAQAPAALQPERLAEWANWSDAAALRTPFETRKPEFGGAIGRAAAFCG